MIKHSKIIGDKKASMLGAKAHSGDKKSPKSKQVHKLNVRINKDRIIEKPLEERIISDEEFIPDFEEKVEHYVENYVDKLEKTKRITLLAGVSFFMLLIVSLYAYNFNSQIKANGLIEENEITNQYNSGQIKDDITSLINSFTELKEVINSDFEQASIDLEKNIIEDQSNILPGGLAEKTENDSIEALKDKLLLENNNE